MKKIFTTIFLVFAVICPFQAQISSTLISSLPDKLKETSALVVYNDFFWTINDSGGENKVYAFNDAGEIEHTVEIQGVKNHDWESLALSENYMLIGDFGNNKGKRKNLKIIAVNISDINKTEANPVFEINFSYPDQTNFVPSNRKTPFDCEAMVVVDDEVWLFTKDWVTFNSDVYTLELRNGEQVAKKKQHFNPGGLITGAALKGEFIFFIGYHDYVPILWKYKIDDLSKPLIKNKMEDLYKYQTEGIAFVGEKLFITCESSAVKQSLLQLHY
ncbi:MAG: hypothetical protein PF489_00865 [Salinivirgaceae bacterium]|jgi:hypothetical protein|nr:hypothetical protein [Salinivirgaceae bacterium]